MELRTRPQELLRPMIQEMQRDVEEITLLIKAPDELFRHASLAKTEIRRKLKAMTDKLNEYTLDIEEDIDEIVRRNTLQIEQRKNVLLSNQKVLQSSIQALKEDSVSQERMERILKRYKSLPSVGPRSAIDWIPDFTLRGTQLLDKLSNHLLPGDLLYLQMYQRDAESFSLQINESTSPSSISLSILSKHPHILPRHLDSLKVEIKYLKSEYPTFELGCLREYTSNEIRVSGSLHCSEPFLVFAFFQHRQICNSPTLVHFSEDFKVNEVDYFVDGLSIERYVFLWRKSHYVDGTTKFETTQSECEATIKDFNLQEENEDVSKSEEKESIPVRTSPSPTKNIIAAILGFQNEETAADNGENLSPNSSLEGIENKCHEEVIQLSTFFNEMTPSNELMEAEAKKKNVSHKEASIHPVAKKKNIIAAIIDFRNEDSRGTDEINDGRIQENIGIELKNSANLSCTDRCQEEQVIINVSPESLGDVSEAKAEEERSPPKKMESPVLKKRNMAATILQSEESQNKDQSRPALVNGNNLEHVSIDVTNIPANGCEKGPKALPVKSPIGFKNVFREDGASCKESLAGSVSKKKNSIISAILDFRKEESPLIPTKLNLSLDNGGAEKSFVNGGNLSMDLKGSANSSFAGVTTDKSICQEEKGSKSLLVESPELSGPLDGLKLSKWQAVDSLNISSP